MEGNGDLKHSLLDYRAPSRRTRLCLTASLLIGVVLVLVIASYKTSSFTIHITSSSSSSSSSSYHYNGAKSIVKSTQGPESVESEIGVVAADDGRCSEIGVQILKVGGHAVDAAVAVALCSGVVHPVSSGLGGGAFIVVRDSASGESLAFDARETAPAASSTDMYKNNPTSKYLGALSAGVPGELAGLHAIWIRYGRLPWRDLFLPSIKLARDGFAIAPYLAQAIKSKETMILADPGLREVFAPGGKVLLANETCFNPKLADTLEEIAEKGPDVFYKGSVGENFIKDVKNSGGILTMEDLGEYKVEIKKALKVEAMGYTLLGMHPPSSGTVGMAMILNILDSYKSIKAVQGLLGLHRIVESMKHMFAVRMDLGDPAFVNTTLAVSNMLSPSFAAKIRQKIVDNTTFSPSYYMPKWSQLTDHGTSHFCVVDSDRNAVSMTTTVNYYFGSGVLSPSTGIVLNNEMDDFSVPSEVTEDQLPPAPANFIKPHKRPLSSMSPLIILMENQLAGVVGGSGGSKIIPAVLQVFLNHFVLGMDPLSSVQKSRVYHGLIPNKIRYENYTAIDGEYIGFENSAKMFLEERGHVLENIGAGAVCQLVVHDLREPVQNWDVTRRIQRKILKGTVDNGAFKGMLTAVSDPRKDGAPAGL
ncbi:Gamma-glutamyltranspeptidase [Rhynchospora pubera]|uniref:Glutathione hydrolase n=1 Tax=Rhynchospora pubera TaxID=906938 RepID=A0AAV8DS97_9POAL|nr:Gamma-glutamyltranspeptidase [Rhynchospora pubera]